MVRKRGRAGSGRAVIRQALLKANVGAFLICCASALVVVGCAGVRSGAPEEQGHTEVTKEQEGTSSGAASSEEARCSQTRTFRIYPWIVYTTNDVPGCPKGGLLSGTDGRDKLDGQDGEDKIRGLGAADELMGGLGSDVIYGGPGDDGLRGDTVDKDVGADVSKDVLHGGPGQDWIDGGKGDDVIYAGDGNDRFIFGCAGDDVLYGGDGNDILDIDFRCDGGRDKLYCGKGWDEYLADRHDYVSSSCEEEGVPPPPLKLDPKDDFTEKPDSP
jgi:hypothetical protein